MSCVAPKGAFYAMPKVALPPGKTDGDYVLGLLRATGILVVYGSGFGTDAADGFFRVVFLAPPSELGAIYDEMAAYTLRVTGPPPARPPAAVGGAGLHGSRPRLHVAARARPRAATSPAISATRCSTCGSSAGARSTRPGLLTGAITWAAFWNGNIFHPEPYSLALSEHMFAQALQIAPVYALTGNIILGYNLLFLSTFVLSAVGAYLLVRDLTGDWRAGLIAGLVFGFLPYRISQIPHLQVMSSQWMPLALWGFHRFIAHGSPAALAGGTAALVLQNWSCGYYLLYFAPFVPLFAVQQLWSAGPARAIARAWASLAAAAVATVALTIPFLLPVSRGAAALRVRAAVRRGAGLLGQRVVVRDRRRAHSPLGPAAAIPPARRG